MQNENHLLDTELIFSYPTKASELDPYLTIESGQTTYLTANQSAYAAGLMQFEKSSVAVAVGRQDGLSSAQRELYNELTTENFELSANPVYLLWSRKNKGHTCAVGVFYSAKNDLKNNESESTQVLHAGYRTGFLTLSANIQLDSQVQAAANKKLKIKDSAALSVLYEVDNFVISGKVETFTSQQSNAGFDLNQINYQILEMALSDSTDFDKNLFFYRIDLIVKNLEYKISGIKEHHNQLPLTLGIESEQNEWLVLRSSIQQTVLIHQAEDIPANINSTTAAFGLGFKFKKVSLDGTLTGLIGPTQSGDLNTNQFLSQVALTSSF